MFTTRKIILLIVLLVVISITSYVVIVVIPTRLAERSYEGAKRIGEDIRNAFQFTPEVTVNNTIVLQQQTSIFELATLSQKFQHQYQWTNTWMNSTKKVHIRGTLEAKAGFNLHESFTVNIHDDKAIVTLPAPTLLSLTPLGDIIFEDENGIWNWVSAEDRSAAINAFNLDAQRYAAQAEFISKARESMEGKLKQIFELHGKDVVIRYGDPLSIDNL